MENIELYKKELNSYISNIEVVEDEKVKIYYGDSILTIETYHNQDCCEHVYADFSTMKHFIEQIKSEEITNLIIKGVKDMGFLLCFEVSYGVGIKVFIPCYNSQNGYYSSNLSLKLKFNELAVEVDISDYVEDQY